MARYIITYEIRKPEGLEEKYDMTKLTSDVVAVCIGMDLHGLLVSKNVFWVSSELTRDALIEKITATAVGEDISIGVFAVEAWTVSDTVLRDKIERTNSEQG